MDGGRGEGVEEVDKKEEVPGDENVVEENMILG